MRENWKTYLLYFVAGCLVALLFTCMGKNGELPDATTEKKIEVRYRYVTRVDTFRDNKPIVKYKYIKNDSLIYISNSTSTQILIDFKPSDYAYSYQKSFWSEGNRVRNDIKLSGWGKLENIESAFTTHDTLADTIKTVTTTKFRPKSALFAGLKYQQSPNGKQNYRGMEIDWNIQNKMLLGVGAGLNEANSFQFGAKIGIKIN